MLNRTLILSAAVGACAFGHVATLPALAVDAGFVSTNRFGYEGTALRYDTMADALAGVNSTDTINITDRDLAMVVASDDTSVADRTQFLGAWWHTTDTFYSPTEGRAGWGNTTGNTGVGFLQMFDIGAVSTTGVSMSFSDFDGSFYTTFDLSVTGENAGEDQFSRFSAMGNNGDGGVWHGYAINLTATGLEGVGISPGVIESTNQPTDVSGSISGLFEITSTAAGQEGFYVVNLALSMDNWAWDNRNDLTPLVSSDGGDTFFDGSFPDSVFRVVPAPGAAAFFALGGAALARRRR
ncbi:MAG: hypothetical protein EA376_05010 [Phycisphaeraceae bacterium]|nr:MAG: hypothetical protein EA376_05010 [Phycisphaeraceae bacterium]